MTKLINSGTTNLARDLEKLSQAGTEAVSASVPVSVTDLYKLGPDIGKTRVFKASADTHGNEYEAWLARARNVPNPYLQDFQILQNNPHYLNSWKIIESRQSIESTKNPEFDQAMKFESDARRSLIDRYAWAIPVPEALATIAKEGPILDAGAGTGYWSHLLKQMGTDVVSFDIQGNNLSPSLVSGLTRRTWTNVLTGNEDLVANYPGRILFMSFPPYGKPFAYNALRNYQGNRFIYIGEGADGMTADGAFHKLLAKKWQLVSETRIPNWDSPIGATRDSLRIYERR